MASPSPRAASGFRNLPNPYAVFSTRFLFTTLSPKDASLGPYAHPTTGKPMHIFSLDDSMYYTPFKNDHGPLNLAYTFDACVKIFEKLSAKEHKRRALCLYSSPDPQIKSNMALMAALYSVIVDHNDPWDAFQPISHFELLPFRDAGNGMNEYALSAQDVLYGVWKAGQNGLLRLQDFDADDYRYYERVENGDLNTIGDIFVAFASPMDTEYILSITAPNDTPPQYSPHQCEMLKGAFTKVLAKFDDEDVGMVVRLNDELYDKAHFVQRDMTHVDLYFDDGTNPTDDIVREFIRLTEATQAKNKKVAVHCKAGLGRTGVLIGAYLIYKYSFTASEVIGYMRIMRPGMVVGPQQRYMHLNQMKWAGWAAIDQARSVESHSGAESLPSPPLECDELEDPVAKRPETPNRPLTPTRRLPATAQKGGDAVGQPRKGRGVVEATSSPKAAPPALSTPTRAIKSDAPSPPTIRTSPAQDGSLRGVKRGSTRAPVPPQTLCAEAATPDNAPRSLVRSTSNVSCSSSASELDQRATKRRTADGQLQKSGLSSPPPSRDATPDDDFPCPPSPIEEVAEPPATPPSRSSSLSAASQTLTPTTPSRDKELRSSRSLIPRRGAKDSPTPEDESVSDSELGTTPTKTRTPRRLIPTPRWKPLRIGAAAAAVAQD